MLGQWDDRDIELDCRNRLGNLIAEMVSGVEGAKADPDDLIMADKVRDMIEESLDL